MAKVRHPNVITVHDVGTDEQRVFIAMEFIDGCTLGDWLVEQRRTREEIIEVFRGAGMGLGAAHGQGLIHRDFKPDNVLIGRDGRVCVVDFGLARRDTGVDETRDERGSGSIDEPPTESGLADEGVGLGALASQPDGLGAITRTGMLLGTPAYMAPEQHLGLLPGAAADQFAFCVALYEALYGERPFAGANAADLLINVTEAKVRPAKTDARVPVPSWIRRVLLRGLCRKPRERWPDMQTLLAALIRAPRGRRRRWQIAAAATVLAIGGGLGGWTMTRNEDPACDGAPQHWAELWDEPAKERYAEAFHATGKAFAEQTWNAVERDGDAYVDAWKESHARACAATHVYAEQSPEVLALRHGCLEAGRQRFIAVAELFEDADEAVVVAAVDALAALPSVRRCGPEAVLRAEARLPDDPELRRELQTQRHALDRARALSRANRLDAARRLAEGALARATALKIDTLEAEALLARADVEEAEGQIAEARASTHAALLLAEQTDDDRLAATAWIDLLWIDGFRLSRHQAGHEAADHAHALLQRWPDTQEQEVLLVSRLGDLLYSEGRYAEALAQHRAALGLREQLGALHDPRRADALTGIGLCELELGDHDAALEHLREAERIYREAYGAGHPHIAAALTNLGMAHDFRKEHEQALAHHEQALALAEAAHGPEHPAVAEILNNHAGVLLALGRFDDAEGAFIRAREIWRTSYGPDHQDLGMVSYNLGVVAQERGDLVGARVLYEDAYRIRKASLGEEHPDTVESLEALHEIAALSEG